MNEADKTNELERGAMMPADDQIAKLRSLIEEKVTPDEVARYVLKNRAAFEQRFAAVECLIGAIDKTLPGT